MSYTVVYTWKCDICGVTAQNAQHSPPTGWVWENGFATIYLGDDRIRQNHCQNCAEAIAKAEADAIASLRQKTTALA